MGIHELYGDRDVGGYIYRLINTHNVPAQLAALIAMIHLLVF
ncbi:hypothetical protein HRbin02_00661 [Candidatus Calditenuaceae archaeon HR02]|nr:hypothetical protein HRbin02_00661 [Candidatus Calditenuaceae archaeon HR02]